MALLNTSLFMFTKTFGEDPHFDNIFFETDCNCQLVSNGKMDRNLVLEP